MALTDNLSMNPNQFKLFNICTKSQYLDETHQNVIRDANICVVTDDNDLDNILFVTIKGHELVNVKDVNIKIGSDKHLYFVASLSNGNDITHKSDLTIIDSIEDIDNLTEENLNSLFTLSALKDYVDKRTSSLNTTVSDMDNRLTQLDDFINQTLKGDMELLNNKVSILNDDVTAYSSTVDTLAERVDILEANIGGSTEGEGDDSGNTEGDSTEDNTGGSTEGEGGDSGSTEGEGENSGSTEPIPASQALEEYNHLIGFITEECFDSYKNETYYKKYFSFISMYCHYYSGGKYYTVDEPGATYTVDSLFKANEGDIVKVYTPDLQEIEVIVDSTTPHHMTRRWTTSIAFCNKETKEIYCYDIDPKNATISPCTDEAFITEWDDYFDFTT